MDNLWTGIGAAIWLGVLTSISPCPLATNIAAISYIGRTVTSPLRVVANGLLYALGRTVTYVMVGFIVSWSLLSIPALSLSLQKYMNWIIGPLLILTGLVILGLIKFGAGSGSRLQEKIGRRAQSWGAWGAVLLGLVFALTFCPVSAALFFGSLIPLAVEHKSAVLMPTLYGIGTALPVFVFATVIAFSANTVGKLFRQTTTLEKWARKITGIAFILIGIYLTLRNGFGIL